MPKKLLVIGSGAIGIEFASFYNELGSDVTVVEMMDRVLPVEDAEISAILTGDLNATPESAPLKKLEEKGWVQEALGQIPQPEELKNTAWLC